MAKFRFSDEALERIFSKEQMGSVPLKYQSIVVHATEEVIGELGNAYEFQSVGTFEQTDISDPWTIATVTEMPTASRRALAT